MKIIERITRINKKTEIFLPSKYGFNGERVFLSEHYVIKIFEEKDLEYYNNELLVYKNLNKSYISSLINYGEVDDVTYLLLSRIKAKALYSIWEDLDNNERADIVKQISNILTDINGIRKVKSSSFKKHIISEYNKYFKKLKVSQRLKDRISKFFNGNIDKIEEMEELFLIYKDNHIDNFLFDGNKVFVIDFEDIIMAPLDFQLDIWNRMTKYPYLFANEEDEKKIKLSSYSNLMGLIKTYYPEMFEYEDLIIRLQIYSLIYDIRILVKYSLDEEEMIDRLNGDLK